MRGRVRERGLRTAHIALGGGHAHQCYARTASSGAVACAPRTRATAFKLERARATDAEGLFVLMRAPQGQYCGITRHGTIRCTLPRARATMFVLAPHAVASESSRKWHETFRWSAVGANTRLPCNARGGRVVCAKPHRGSLAKIVARDNREWACRRRGPVGEGARPACAYRRARFVRARGHP